MKRPIVLATLLVVGALSMVIARAQQDLTTIQIEKVKDRLYIVTGGRGSGAQAGPSAATPRYSLPTAG